MTSISLGNGKALQSFPAGGWVDPDAIAKFSMPFTRAAGKLTNAATVAGGAQGALIGAAAGGLLGDSSDDAKTGAIIGGAGGAIGTRQFAQKKLQSIRRNPVKRLAVGAAARKLPVIKAEISKAGRHAGPPAPGMFGQASSWLQQQGGAQGLLDRTAGFLGRQEGESSMGAIGRGVREFREGLSGGPKRTAFQRWNDTLADRARTGYEQRAMKYGARPAAAAPSLASGANRIKPNTLPVPKFRTAGSIDTSALTRSLSKLPKVL